MFSLWVAEVPKVYIRESMLGCPSADETLGEVLRAPGMEVGRQQVVVLSCNPAPSIHRLCDLG